MNNERENSTETHCAVRCEAKYVAKPQQQQQYGPMK